MKVWNVHAHGHYLGSVHARDEAEARQAAIAKFGDLTTDDLVVSPAGY